MPTETIHVDVITHIPLDSGGTLPLRQGIAAHPTDTPGLVTFPSLAGILASDDSVWHVTHTPTGRRIPVSFTSQDDATAYANSVGTLGDWTQIRPTVDPLAVLRAAIAHNGTLDDRYQGVEL